MSTAEPELWMRWQCVGDGCGAEAMAAAVPHGCHDGVVIDAKLPEGWVAEQDGAGLCAACADLPHYRAYLDAYDSWRRGYSGVRERSASFAKKVVDSWLAENPEPRAPWEAA